MPRVRLLAGPVGQRAEPIPRWRRRHALVGIDFSPGSCQVANVLLEQACDHIRLEGADAPWGDLWSTHCVNPLTNPEFSEQLFDGRLPVILGNPPYNNFGHQNRHPWIL